MNDLDWQDRYRMFSFAANHDVLEADFWRVGLQLLDSFDIPITHIKWRPYQVHVSIHKNNAINEVLEPGEVLDVTCR